MSEEEAVISVENLSKLYPIKRNFFQSLTSKATDFVHAVDGLSFKIHKGETLGLVGESGCGKSTTGYLTLNLLNKTDTSNKGANDWAGPTAYTDTDRVYNVDDNKLYTCILSHISSEANQPPNATYWQRANGAIWFKTYISKKGVNDWVGRPTAYTDTDGVYNVDDNKLYTCILSHTSSEANQPPNATYWHRTDGAIWFKDIDIHSISKNEMRKLREKMQIIFQNPYDSLSPRFTVVDIIAEPVRLLNVLEDENEIYRRIKEIMEQVGLTPAEEFMERFPHELSGGQRQRVGVARAFVLNPEYVVADEPVSMLDVSLRIGVLRIMKNLINTYGTAFLFITHDLALARYMCDRIAVMYLGMIVENGPSEMVTQTPKHPYTRALIAAVPNADPNESSIKEIPIIGEISDGIHLPEGCRFEYRCIYAQPKCAEKQPKLVEIGKNHFAACIRISEIDDLVAMGEMPTKETPKDEPTASSTGS